MDMISSSSLHHQAADNIPAAAAAAPPPLFHESTKLKMLNSGNNNNNNNNHNGTAMDEIRALEIKSPPVNRSLNSGNNKDKRATTTTTTTTRYRECQKNHAASLGSHAVDGCGEFMPSGEEGAPDALKCAACGCHRNFHRREVEGEMITCDCHKKDTKKRGTQVSAATAMAYPSSVTQFHKPPMTPIPMMAISTGAADSDEHEGGGGGDVGGGTSPSNIKKRFRTKFSTEQKDEMYNFAEKLGWKMQKHDEAAVQEFCANIGVKRHVLKVWMHNNKHIMAKKA